MCTMTAQLRLVEPKPKRAQRNLNHKQLIPWSMVCQEDRVHHFHILLRYMHPDRVDVPTVRQISIRNLKRQLLVADEVINYDPDHDPHWHRVKRRYREDPISGLRVPVDTGIIRDPRIDDEGREIN